MNVLDLKFNNKSERCLKNILMGGVKRCSFYTQLFFLFFFSWQQSDLHNLVNEVIMVTQSSSDELLSYLHDSFKTLTIWNLVALVFNISTLGTSNYFIVGYSDFKMKYLLTISRRLIKS